MLAEKRITWPQIYDGKRWKADLAKFFNVDGIPTNYLLDRDGKIVSKDLSKKEFKDLIKKTVEKKTVDSPAESSRAVNR